MNANSPFRPLPAAREAGSAGSRGGPGGWRSTRATTIAVVAAVVSAWIVPAASGHTVFKKQLERRYPGLVVKCEACHVKGKPKTETNDFGKLFNAEMASADLTAQWKALEGVEKKKFELETMKPLFLAALDKIKPLENPDGVLWADLLDTGKLPNTKLRKGVDKASDGAIPDDEVEELPADEDEGEEGDEGDSGEGGEPADEAADDGSGSDSAGDEPADDSGDMDDSDDQPDGEGGAGDGGSAGEGDGEGSGSGDGTDGSDKPSDNPPPPADEPKDSGTGDQPKDGGGGGGGGGDR